MSERAEVKASFENPKHQPSKSVGWFCSQGDHGTPPTASPKELEPSGFPLLQSLVLPSPESFPNGPHDLTPAEIIALMTPANHPERLTAAELEQLLCPLTDAQVEEVIDGLGLDTLVRQLPLVLLTIMRAAQRIVRGNPPGYVVRSEPPEYEDEIDHLVRNFDLTTLESSTPSPSSREPPATPVRAGARPPRPSSVRGGARPSRSTPFTPRTSNNRAYIVDSPTMVGRTILWLEAGAHTLGVSGASARSTGRRSGPRKSPAKAYAVFYGGKVAVFQAWADVQHSITGNGLAIYAGFPSVEAAEAALAYARTKGWTADSSPPTNTSPAAIASASYEDNPLNASGTISLWTYLECSLNVCGVKGNLYSSFPTHEEAESAFSAALAGNWVHSIARYFFMCIFVQSNYAFPRLNKAEWSSSPGDPKSRM
ncbi:hypothetical protein B0H19DRAFT_1077013 [Mycena capillaripes]|nr:hypothetical protein B0H19DRAFT_1077013 [Mycena capillaripes]